ncbi:MAG: hypothetical protein ACR2RE_08035 [Geminicoccaceae bacterium]
MLLPQILAIESIAWPKPGWYRMRQLPKAPWTAVMIYQPCPLDPEFGGPLDRWRYPVALIDGEQEADPYPMVPYLQPISRQEHDEIVALRRAAEERAPWLPEASPDKPINLAEMPAIF